MLCDRMFRALIASRSQQLVPIWSSRPNERLVSMRFTPPTRLIPKPSLFSTASSSSSSFSTNSTLSMSSVASSHSLSDGSSSGSTSSVTIEMQNGLPHITVPLPSRSEPCVFVLKPVTHSVGEFLAMLQCEDAGIDRAIIRTPDGVRIASTTSIQSLLKGDFLLIINDTPYTVRPPLSMTQMETGAPVLSEDDIQRLGDVRALIGQLYEALNVEEHHAVQEKRLVEEMEALREELEPLEQQKIEIQRLADKRTNHLTWLGLGMMSVQFGILARLTWWEYSWDIMEPVTYFVTYGTAMACYAYFVLTKQDYVLPDVRDRQYLLSFHKKAKREFWDVHKYNSLKDGLAKVERDLKRLRDPLHLRKSTSKLLTDSIHLKSRLNDVGGLLNSQINMGRFKDLLKGKLS